MAGGRFYGLASHRIRPQNGSRISSRKHAAGNKLPAIAFVTGTGPMDGEVFIRRLRSMGIRDRPTSPRSPWQNGYAERLIGSIRRECLDHVVVFGERHLRHMLQSYMKYHNEIRTHLSLEKDASVSRAVKLAGTILCRPVLAGCTTNMFGFDLRQAQVAKTIKRRVRLNNRVVRRRYQ